MKDFKETLDEVISDELNELASIELGSDEYKTTVEGLTKLIDKSNDIDKINLEEKKLKLSVKREVTLDKFNKRDKYINYGITIGGILIPVFVTIWGTCKTLKFETTDTVTTTAGKSFMSKLFRK